jgi:hypothetical protein
MNHVQVVQYAAIHSFMLSLSLFLFVSFTPIFSNIYIHCIYIYIENDNMPVSVFLPLLTSDVLLENFSTKRNHRESRMVLKKYGVEFRVRFFLAQS